MDAVPVEGEPARALLREDVAAGSLNLNVRLQCPRCRADLEVVRCLSCGFQLRDCGGIIDALPPEGVSHYAHFIEDYERIRAAEGRGSQTEAFYLELPYKDVSEHNAHQWRIRSRSYDCLMECVIKPNFPERGARILDLGAGNSWMSYRLANAGYRPFAVDLLVNDSDGLGAAKHYRGRLPELFPRFRAELAHLPFQDEQFDAAIFNASFHYAEDYVAILGEALRCVRIGGLVIVSDTPWYSSERGGRQMLAERRAVFLLHYGTPSDSISSLEFLTDERLRVLEEHLSIRWIIFTPRYGFRWSMRPLLAMLCRRREPSRFHIYVARKIAA